MESIRKQLARLVPQLSHRDRTAPATARPTDPAPAAPARPAPEAVPFDSAAPATAPAPSAAIQDASGLALLAHFETQLGSLHPAEVSRVMDLAADAYPPYTAREVEAAAVSPTMRIHWGIHSLQPGRVQRWEGLATAFRLSLDAQRRGVKLAGSDILLVDEGKSAAARQLLPSALSMMSHVSPGLRQRVDACVGIVEIAQPGAPEPQCAVGKSILSWPPDGTLGTFNTPPWIQSATVQAAVALVGNAARSALTEQLRERFLDAAEFGEPVLSGGPSGSETKERLPEIAERVLSVAGLLVQSQLYLDVLDSLGRGQLDPEVTEQCIQQGVYRRFLGESQLEELKEMIPEGSELRPAYVALVGMQRQLLESARKLQGNS